MTSGKAKVKTQKSKGQKVKSRRAPFGPFAFPTFCLLRFAFCLSGVTLSEEAV